MNYACRPLSEDEVQKITSTIASGYTTKEGKRVRGNLKVATALLLEANIGLRISDILQLRLNSFTQENGKYKLNIKEKKMKKQNNFFVAADVYIFIQSYCITMNISKQGMPLFDITERAVHNFLVKALKYLGLDKEPISTHSFRKFYAKSIYKINNNCSRIVQEALHHSSLVVTQRYLGIAEEEVNEVLEKHICLPAFG